MATSAEATTSQIFSLLTQYGEGDYIGERISQLQHSLQAAHFASQYPSADSELTIAALLHDIGQFLPATSLTDLSKSLNLRIESMSENVGRVGHETLGAEYLRHLGFSSKVCALVAAHVPAKRFLCAIDGQYWEGLSETSKKSLVYQGGIMSDDEVSEWKSGEWWEEMVELRKCDDRAKVEGLDIGGLERWKGLIEEHLRERLQT